MVYYAWSRYPGKSIIEQVQPNNIVEKDLFKCVINLTDYFFRQTHASPKQTAGYFKAYSAIIDTDQAGQTKTKSRQKKVKKTDANLFPNAESEFLSFDIQVLSFPAKKERNGRVGITYFPLCSNE